MNCTVWPVFDPKNPDKTSNFNTSVTVYDSVGTARLVTLYFNKQADGATWDYHAMIDGADAQNGKPGELMEMATAADDCCSKRNEQQDTHRHRRLQ